jgi:NAD(P)H-dependent FMN reductase
MVKIQIILGSTRPGRVGEQVAKWVYAQAKQHKGMQAELVDLADYDLPLLDEPLPPSMGQPYAKEHTKKWSQKISQADGYIFVTAEYDHGVPGALKNAIDYLFHEWNDKAAGFVSYGSAGGVRAVEQLRQVMGEIKIADVRTQLFLPLAHDFESYSNFVPTDAHEATINTVFEQVVAWAEALKPLRVKAEVKKQIAVPVAA